MDYKIFGDMIYIINMNTSDDFLNSGFIKDTIFTVVLNHHS